MGWGGARGLLPKSPNMGAPFTFHTSKLQTERYTNTAPAAEGTGASELFRRVSNSCLVHQNGTFKKKIKIV